MNVKKVKTEADLRLYLTRKWWDCIIIDEGINLYEPVPIYRDVILQCSKNGAVFSLHTDETDHSLFVCKSGVIEFCSMRISMIPNQSGISSAIKFDNGAVFGSVHNSNIQGFSWGGIWHFNCQNLLVGRTTIYGNRGTSYNYGIWQGGKTDIPEMKLTMLNCDVKDVRHAIGASYHPNSYYAISNVISTTKHSFDRHNWNGGGGIRKGGLHTVISGNTFLDENRLAFSIEPPYEGGSFVFTGNTLNHSKERHIGEIAGERVWEGSGNNYMIGANNFTDQTPP